MTNDLPKIIGKYREDVNLGSTTWFATGGIASTLFKPHNQNDLVNFLKSHKRQVNILGNCSNILIRDGILSGVTIKLGKPFADIKLIDDNTIEVGASVLDFNLANFALNNSISGFEFLIGIPGSIGGNIRMNAGCYGDQISDIFISCEAIDLNGNIHHLTREDLGFSYRNISLREKLIFTKAVLSGKKLKNNGPIEDRMQQINNDRNIAQPTHVKTSGSTFKNPALKKAWQLIDKAGMRGFSIGDAMISEKHCNFFINRGSAKASEIEALGELTRKIVYEKTGIMLEWEVEIIGSY